MLIEQEFHPTGRDVNRRLRSAANTGQAFISCPWQITNLPGTVAHGVGGTGAATTGRVGQKWARSASDCSPLQPQAIEGGYFSRRAFFQPQGSALPGCATPRPEPDEVSYGKIKRCSSHHGIGDRSPTTGKCSLTRFLPGRLWRISASPILTLRRLWAR